MGSCAAFTTVCKGIRPFPQSASAAADLLCDTDRDPAIRRAEQARIVLPLKRTRRLHAIPASTRRAWKFAGAQTIVVPREVGTARLIRGLAAKALEARQKITCIENGVESTLSDNRDGVLIRLLPGVRVVLTAEYSVSIGSIGRFSSADTLAAAAALVAVERQSGKRARMPCAFTG